MRRQRSVSTPFSQRCREYSELDFWELQVCQELTQATEQYF